MGEVSPTKEPVKNRKIWELSTDESSSVEGSMVGLELTPPSGGVPLRYALALTFKCTNNEAEYEAVSTGVRLA